MTHQEFASAPALSDRALALLSQGQGDQRLSEHQRLQLALHVPMIASWADRVPQKASFIIPKWPEVLVMRGYGGLSVEELGIAAYLLPLYSQLEAISLHTLWKANQLIRALCTALDAGDLIVAATMARSLMETTAAFGCESNQIAELWRARRLQPAPDMASLREFVGQAQAVVGQILFGTRLKRGESPLTGIQRTNILTLIDKAQKLSGRDDVRRLYEVLCDTVHPSIGSSRCFWSQEADPDDGPLSAFEMRRTARGELSELPFVIGLAALWALVWLGMMWNRFDQARKDLCLTGKLYVLPPVSSIITRPGKAGEHCPCGSARLFEECEHYFGRPSRIDMGEAS